MSARKALVVGIDHYAHSKKFQILHGCCKDAYQIQGLLDRNSDGSVNFAAKMLAGSSATAQVTRSALKAGIQELFLGDSEIALFYFAGHGHIEDSGAYLIASDTQDGSEGIPYTDLLTLANKSPAKNRIIILDSCHSGAAASDTVHHSNSELKEGTVILTAATAEQYATEENGKGVFSTLMADALNGAAGNLLGEVTPGSVYAHIDQSLGAWDQRPVFKTNVKSFVSLRKVQPPISLQELQQLKVLFPTAGFEYKLDPTYEPERRASPTRKAKVGESIPPPDPLNVQKFSILQKYNRVNLVVPVDAPHMWHAAMQSKSCKLTVLGEHYRRLVEKNRI